MQTFRSTQKVRARSLKLWQVAVCAALLLLSACSSGGGTPTGPTAGVWDSSNWDSATFQ